MRKYVALLMICSIAAGSSLSAQTAEVEVADTIPIVGEGAVSSSQMAKENEWQNWVFAAGAIVAATVGVIVAIWSQGSSSSSH